MPLAMGQRIPAQDARRRLHVISKWREAQTVRMLVQSIHLEVGEDQHSRDERVGKYLGLSGKTIYNYQQENGDGGRIGLNAFLRLVDLVQRTRPDLAREALEIVCKAVGMRLREEEK